VVRAIYGVGLHDALAIVREHPSWLNKQGTSSARCSCCIYLNLRVPYNSSCTLPYRIVKGKETNEYLYIHLSGTSCWWLLAL
jgi:hypothetical protein